MTLEQLHEKCPLPAILHWEQNGFVVLYDIRKSQLTGNLKYYVANPAYGKHSGFTDRFLFPDFGWMTKIVVVGHRT